VRKVLAGFVRREGEGSTFYADLPVVRPAEKVEKAAVVS
jgi:hypothetical protein